MNVEAQIGVCDRALGAHLLRSSLSFSNFSFVTKLNTPLAYKSEKLKGDPVGAGVATCPVLPSVNQRW